MSEMTTYLQLRKVVHHCRYMWNSPDKSKFTPLFCHGMGTVRKMTWSIRFKWFTILC